MSLQGVLGDLCQKKNRGGGVFGAILGKNGNFGKKSILYFAAYFCARRPQIWTPEEKYYQKMSSHTQIGQLGPKLGKKCLKMCLNARCRVFLRVPTSDLSSSAKVLPENVLKHPIYTAQTWETVLTFRWARIFKRNHSALFVLGVRYRQYNGSTVSLRMTIKHFINSFYIFFSVSRKYWAFSLSAIMCWVIDIWV